MTVKVQLLDALRDAERRGLTRRECGNVAGSHYTRRLRELEADGHVLHYKRGRYGGRAWWRVTLVLEARAPEPEVVEPPLFDVVPAPRPASALLELEDQVA